MKKYMLLIATMLLIKSMVFSQICENESMASQISIDTIYYNSEWKVVSSNLIADYYRVKINSEREVNRQFRDYFITGELQAKGGYISMDNEDDANTIFNGKCINYYKSGRISEEKTYLNGKLNGDYTIYNEDGLIRNHVAFINNKMNGIYTEFNEDGLCIQIQYYNGEADKYYTVSNSNGCVMKFDTETNNPIWESPLLNEKQTEYRDGVAWPYYNKNGILVSMSNSLVKDYGKYYKITIVIANNSLVPIEFDPAQSIYATSTSKKNVTDRIAVLSSDEYIKKVRRSQNWQSALVGFSEGLAAFNAGYSTSTTQTNSYASGSAYAYETGGSAYGSYNGYSNSISTTRQYDAAAAYQAQVIASNRIATFESSLLNERQIKEEGYLKKTTIQPTEIISGYVNIERSSRDTDMSVIININGAEYTFNWSNE